jgi:type IV fimbrial biogenesis protein FimT
MKRESRESGVGTVEALCVVAVVAVVAAMAAPSLVERLARDRVASAVNALVHAVGIARAEAIRLGTAVTVCRAARAGGSRCAGDGADWSGGWLVVVGDGAVAGRVLRAHFDDAQRLAVTLAAPVSWKITITGAGVPVGTFAGGSFRVCVPGRPELGRAIVLSRAARVRVAAETC